MICPNCQNEKTISEQNYGALYTCGSCQAVYFINFEGQPEYGEVPTEAPTDLVVEDPPLSDSGFDQDSDSKFSENLDAVLDSQMANFNDVASFSEVSPYANSSQNDSGDLEPQIDSNFVVETDNFATPEPSVDTQPESFEPNADINLDFNSTDYLNNDSNPFEASSNQPPSEVKEKSAFQNIADEISSFGNKEVQLSSINYDLLVSGLDSMELKKLYREAVEDSRLALDVEELMRNIKNGESKLEKLNPVKAFVIAKRLQFVDVEKKWTQNVLS